MERISQPPAAAPKWPIPDGIKTIEVNGYDMAYQEVELHSDFLDLWRM